MKPPIHLNENGDRTTFDTVEQAEGYMEPVDVDNGEYVVSDADGKRLCATVVTAEERHLGGLWTTRVKRVRIIDSG